MKPMDKRIAIYFYEDGSTEAYIEISENDGDPRQPDRITHWRNLKEFKFNFPHYLHFHLFKIIQAVVNDQEICEKTYTELNHCKRCHENTVKDTFDICQECVQKAISGIQEVAGKHIEQVFTADGQIYVLFSNGTWEYR